MALADYALPFGLRQVKLIPLLADGSEDTANAVFLPASRTFSFADTEEFETLEGDDRTVASHGAGPTVDWELEGGGISLAVWKVLAGGTNATSALAPMPRRPTPRRPPTPVPTSMLRVVPSLTMVAISMLRFSVARQMVTLRARWQMAPSC